MNKTLCVLIVCLWAAFSGISEAGLSIDISGSNCTVLDSQTIRLRNIATGLGDLWADFRWDPNNYIFYPVNAGMETTPVGPGHAPVVSNLSVVGQAAVGETICVSYSYSDEDGLPDVKEHHVVMSDGSEAVIDAGGSGRFKQCDFYFAAAGTYTIQVYVVDSEGNKSNVLTAQVVVTAQQTVKPHIVYEKAVSICGDFVAGCSDSGWYVTDLATVNQYVGDVPYSVDVNGYIGAAELSANYNYVRNNVLGTLGLWSRDTSLIALVSPDTLSVPYEQYVPETICYYAYRWESSKQKYRRLLISCQGARNIYNTDPEALIIDQWLKSITY